MWAAKEVPGPCCALLTRAGSCPHSDLCLRDSFQELSVPGLNWIIIQTLPFLPASRIWIISNRELFLKDATDPSQQMNLKLRQRQSEFWNTFFHDTHDISLDDQDAKWTEQAKLHCFSGCLYMQHTQYYSIYWVFLIKSSKFTPQSYYSYKFVTSLMTKKEQN